ncbi:LON peptidase substrate-binding domain-containing protein [Paraferrimonas sp. SM1919]|uniref:LON peptidase substrate-binding domain-containing protein n=1 Tax=Paraferrimonas sp. SM1919 TaxID=2662263 RepID=UPI0013D2D401|nr:LON peptidase substrate-binding domain-containing protein [Paraferrimonas sp. SM1919]
MKQLPIFPLNAHVFPKGKLSLKIFEPRYLNMVKQHVSNSPSFLMGMLSQDNKEILNLACEVNVIDFNRLDGGLLGITVEGTQMVEVHSNFRKDDGLNIANYSDCNIWPDSTIEADLAALLHNQYQQIINDYPQLSNWYKGCDFSNKYLLLRLLEWMPIAAEQKVLLLQQPKLAYVANYLNKFLHIDDPLTLNKRN